MNDTGKLEALLGTLKQHEKAHFRKSVAGFSHNNKQYWSLFEAMVGQEEKSREAVLDETGILPSNLDNVRHYLYDQLLQSLHRYHSGRSDYEEQLLSQLGQAKVLNLKKLNKQAYLAIRQVLNKAVKAELYLVAIKAIDALPPDFLHGTRIFSREKLTTILTQLREQKGILLAQYQEESNARSLREALFLCLDRTGEERVPAQLRRQLEEAGIGESLNSVIAKVHLNHAWFLFHFMQLNLPEALAATGRTIQFFETKKALIRSFPQYYNSILANRLAVITMGGTLDQFYETRDLLMRFLDRKTAVAPSNNLLLGALINEINLLSRLEQYEKAKQLVPDIKKRMAELLETANPRAVNYLFTAIAEIYFVTREPQLALDWFTQLLKLPEHDLIPSLRVDAEISMVLCRYELGQFDILESAIRSLKRRKIGRIKKQVLQAIEKMIGAISPKEERKILENLLGSLNSYAEKNTEEAPRSATYFAEWVSRQLS